MRGVPRAAIAGQRARPPRALVRGLRMYKFAVAGSVGAVAPVMASKLPADFEARHMRLITKYGRFKVHGSLKYHAVGTSDAHEIYLDLAAEYLLTRY